MPELPSLTASQRRWLLEDAHRLLRGTEPPARTEDSWTREFLRVQLGFVRRMRRRFPSGQTWVWTDRSLAQASDWWSAQYKAALFPTGEHVADICCGAGVDSAAIALRGPITAQDADPYLLDLMLSNTHARLGEMNAQNVEIGRESHNEVSILAGRFPDLFPKDVAWMHADPDRRTAVSGNDQKTLNAEQFDPSLTDLLQHAATVNGAVIKLAPLTRFTQADTSISTDLEQLPMLEELAVPWRRIWLSSYDECRQQLLVLGNCCPDDMPHGEHRAALCYPIEAEYTGPPQLTAEVSKQPLRFLYDLHPCLSAASLKGAWAREHGLEALADHSGYYTSDDAIDSPFAQRLEVIDVIPWDDRQVRKWLRKFGAGIVEVKCRLAPVDATQAQKRYSRDTGEQPVTLVVTRIEKRVRAIACLRT
ncbi:MAG TPA: hypothetical protein DDW52_17310 [Planctomycetaceae bacterium]|nr:hypothetical protein [Planctomycetaceae bacterium]